MPGQGQESEKLRGFQRGVSVRGQVRVWGECCCSGPQYGWGRGGEMRDTHTHTGTHTHTEERTRECCTYPLATYEDIAPKMWRNLLDFQAEKEA